ncbi:MAG TPA: DUF503 domain-containing protein [Nitrospiria bacterium]|jgi:hypothetical protein
MTVGICTLVLYLPGIGSLKGKRQIIKSLKDRVQNRFNVSIAEVGDQDLWQRAVLGIACVGNDRGFVNQVLDKVLDFVQRVPTIEVLDFRLEFN